MEAGHIRTSRECLTICCALERKLEWTYNRTVDHVSIRFHVLVKNLSIMFHVASPKHHMAHLPCMMQL